MVSAQSASAAGEEKECVLLLFSASEVHTKEQPLMPAAKTLPFRRHAHKMSRPFKRKGRQNWDQIRLMRTVGYFERMDRKKLLNAWHCSVLFLK